MFSIHLTDYVVIAVYLLLIILVGAIFVRFTSNSGDFFKSGSRATWWLVGTSIYMGSFSAWTFTGAAGTAYLAGWSILCIFAGSLFGFLLNYLCYAAWFRQMRATTVPEVIRQRFGAATSQFYAWVGVLISLPTASLTLYGLAIFCASVFHMDVTLTIIITGAAVVIYSTFGGTWSMMATDFVQGLILIPLTIALAVLCLMQFGGIGGFFAAIHKAGLIQAYAVAKPAGLFPNDAYTWAWGAALFFRNMTNDISLQAAPRFFAAKDGRDAARAALLCSGLLLVGMLTWFIPPITARLLFTEDVALVGRGLTKPAEAAYVVAGLKLLPAGFTGIMVVAMLAATMSTMVETGLSRNAAIIVRDIIPSLYRRFGLTPPNEIAQLRAGRWATIALGGILIGMAVHFAGDKSRGVFELMTETGALLATPLAAPMIMAILFRRTPPWAAIVAACAGFSLSFLSYFSESFFGTRWNLQTTVFTNFTAGALTFCATIPWWNKSPAAYRARVEAFFTRMITPVVFETEIGQASDPLQLRLLGWLTVVTGALLELLLLFPNPLSGRLMILGVGGSVVAVGGLMVRTAYKLSKADPSKTE